MRKTTIAASLLAVCCAASATACSSTDAKSEDPATVRLALTSDGTSNLLLNGSPSNARYVAQYPNPDHLTSLDFVLGGDGVPVTRCMRGDAVVVCGETPFFTELSGFTGTSDGVSGDATAAPSGSSTGTSDGTSDGKAKDESSGSGGSKTGKTSDGEGSDGTAGGAPGATGGSAGGSSPGAARGDGAAHVYDIFGVEVCRKKLDGGAGGSSGASSNGTTASGSTCGGSATGGAPGNGGFSKNGTAAACEAGSLADRPGCDGATVGAAAKTYCDAVNAQLQSNQKIDCTVLTNPSYVPTPLPSARTGGDCSEYWGPARSAVTSTVYASCEKVTLLLTQWRDRSRHELIAHGVCTSSPLVLDLDGDGIHLSGLEQGVSFDLLGAGEKVWSAWTDGRDAFLALDRNGNGVIDGAAELFGNATEGGTYADGFAALAALDENADGVIDAKDAVFAHLTLWRDANRDGVSAPAELTTLPDAGLRSLALSAARRDRASSLDTHGNTISLVGEFARRDGTRGLLVDAFLRYRPR